MTSTDARCRRCNNRRWVLELPPEPVRFDCPDCLTENKPSTTARCGRCGASDPSILLWGCMERHGQVPHKFHDSPAAQPCDRCGGVGKHLWKRTSPMPHKNHGIWHEENERCPEYGCHRCDNPLDQPAQPALDPAVIEKYWRCCHGISDERCWKCDEHGDEQTRVAQPAPSPATGPDDGLVKGLAGLCEVGSTSSCKEQREWNPDWPLCVACLAAAQLVEQQQAVERGVEKHDHCCKVLADVSVERNGLQHGAERLISILDHIYKVDADPEDTEYISLADAIRDLKDNDFVLRRALAKGSSE